MKKLALFGKWFLEVFLWSFVVALFILFLSMALEVPLGEYSLKEVLFGLLLFYTISPFNIIWVLGCFLITIHVILQEIEEIKKEKI
ncbi:MAG: hypothetical protein QW270_05695 [Candidatus Bathyarchaeia archaeon]